MHFLLALLKWQENLIGEKIALGAIADDTVKNTGVSLPDIVNRPQKCDRFYGKWNKVMPYYERLFSAMKPLWINKVRKRQGK